MNVKTAVASSLSVRRSLGLSGMLDRLGLGFDGTPHRGIDDARNIARIVRFVRTDN